MSLGCQVATLQVPRWLFPGCISDAVVSVASWQAQEQGQRGAQNCFGAQGGLWVVGLVTGAQRGSLRRQMWSSPLCTMLRVTLIAVTLLHRQHVGSFHRGDIHHQLLRRKASAYPTALGSRYSLRTLPHTIRSCLGWGETPGSCERHPKNECTVCSSGGAAARGKRPPCVMEGTAKEKGLVRIAGAALREHAVLAPWPCQLRAASEVLQDELRMGPARLPPPPLPRREKLLLGCWSRILAPGRHLLALVFDAFCS